MNRNEFINIIRDPGLNDRHIMGEVRELVSLFPWFQSAHLLLLKNLHDSGDVRFGTQLRQSAIHVADREVLYYLLLKKNSIEKDSTQKGEGENTMVGENPEDLATGQTEYTGNTVKTISEEPFNLTGLPVTESLAGKVVPEARMDDTDQTPTVIDEARNSQDMITGLENERTVTEPGSPPARNEDFRVEVAAQSSTDESASVVLVIDTDGNHIEETFTYMDPSISLEDEQFDLLELDENEDFESIDIKGDVTATPVNQGKDRKKIQSELIDKFIEANPRIEPVRIREDVKLPDIAERFTEERTGLVSETLAKIYISQGYYSRAIDIYEKLSLKYPEKSSYFATQIEKVKALIK
ncbi:MAG: hypothetical protein U0X39_07770 [Bacteroidales bacterium]